MARPYASVLPEAATAIFESVSNLGPGCRSAVLVAAQLNGGGFFFRGRAAAAGRVATAREAMNSSPSITRRAPANVDAPSHIVVAPLLDMHRQQRQVICCSSAPWDVCS
jgi:hypothetical protein